MLNYPSDKRLAIVYLSYHCELYLERAIEAWKKINYPFEKMSIVVVDNPHPNYGSSVEFIKEKLMPLSGNILPEVIFLPQEKNLGFAGGNNIGVRWAIDNKFDYVFFHNQDGLMSPDCLVEAVKIFDSDKNIAVAQSRVMLYPEIELLNTAGNNFHYLGFGYCRGYREYFQDMGAIEIGYASGAAMLARVDLLEKYAGFDEDFFAYHEDLEYSLRLRMLGYKIVLASRSVFFHEYEFSRHPSKYYLMERNRLGVMIAYFKWPTLLFFEPMQIGVYLAEFFSACKNGWLKSWFMVLVYWLRLDSWKLWLKKRSRIQSIRKISDRDLLRLAVGRIIFDSHDTNGFLVRIGNIIVDGYWGLIKRLIVW